MMLKEIDFLGKRKFAAIFSGLLLLIAVGSLAVQGLKFGIDFTGGSLVEIAYKKAVDLTVMRAGLEIAGIHDATVQHFGSSQEVLIRLKPQAGVSDAEISTAVLNAVNAGMNEQGDVRRVEFVGPQVGDELAEDGGLALLYSMFGILIYVAWRFEYKFALGSVAALAHDVLITLGVFSVFQLEFDLTVLAAILAVIGYSLNDTIVVYDRIRENFRLLRKGSAEEVMNASLNQTLSRTLMTSLTTLLVLVALAVLGGEIIHNFAIALLIGVVIGTYSSVYVASPLVLVLGVSKEDLMEPDVEVEGKEFDMMP
ncbi:MAG: protein translocase subunit SecF [Methyloprofundus sp.]|nr:protein translocase subunit SecF [Methyloprofundus sp.]MDT8426096.1 protein translocase subunit SecF [Methyloprofundus sp.]